MFLHRKEFFQALSLSLSLSEEFFLTFFIIIDLVILLIQYSNKIKL